MAQSEYLIKDIAKLVRFDGKVKNVEVSRLTAPGENYVSIVLKVDFEVEKNGHSKVISSIAKRLPMSYKTKDDYGLNGFAMRNEIKWYLEIVPQLKKFAEENQIKMDFYPEYYGSRYGLDASKREKVDNESVLLLENLIPQGYHNDDRYIGSDFITSKAILKNLALFHALPIAIKVKKPDLFQVIKDFFEKTRPDANGPPPGPPAPPPGAKSLPEMLLEALDNIPDFAPYLTKVRKLLLKPMDPEAFNKLTKEPWNTVLHNDFWVNNVMINSNNGKEPLIKIVDFQMGAYGSYVKDLIFFLLTSVRNDVTKEFMDDLLRIYYDEFTSILRQANVELKLTYQEYLEEVQTVAAESEVGHAIFFATIIFGEKGTGVDVDVEEFNPQKHFGIMLKNMNQYHKDKLVLIASEAIRRNWI